MATALTIAGSDSGAGAGIQADLKTFSALGVYGATVVTAVTAQNTRDVVAIEILPTRIIEAQLEAVFGDIRIDAVKIGMVGSATVIETVAAHLERRGVERIVLDPVLTSTSGRPLLDPAALDALRDRLLPLATLVTPNLPEVGALLGRPPPARAEIFRSCRELLDLGAEWVLATGGEGEGDESVDYLAGFETEERYSAPRKETENTHGSGCTLSSAVAAGLARGLDMKRAVATAKAYVTGAIEAADDLGLGRGRGPLHHFHRWWRG